MKKHWLSVRLLGDLEVVRDGESLPLPQSKKTRALLAYLAATGRPHRRERLCELFWDTPNDPRGELRWSLSKLRGVLDEPGRPRLLADRQSVRLDAADIEIDLPCLRSRLGRSPEAVSVQDLEWAARTLRGPFLEGLELPGLPGFHAWCAAEREDARLLHARVLRALIGRCDKADAALAHARVLVALDPYDIDDRAALIRMLLAQGRTGEAERQFEAGMAFARDLGGGEVERLQALRRELRKAPRGLTAGSGSPARVAPPQAGGPAARKAPAIGRLFGRAQEWNRMVAALEAAAGGSGHRVVALTGEPGIGKTCLLDALTAEVRRRGGTVLAGMAHEVETGRPYGPWIDALRAARREDSGRAAARNDPGGAAEDRLLALLEGSAGLPGTGFGRERTFRVLAELLTGRARGHGLLLVTLDNLQWCDEASAALFHFAVRACVGDAVVFALAARTGELPDSPPARGLLHALRSETPLVEIALGPLDPEATARLAATLAPADEHARIAELSRGNPLVALELARSPTLDGDIAPPSLAQLLRARIDRLPVAAKDLLAWCAVLGAVREAPVLEALTGQDVRDLVAALDVLERHALIRMVEQGHGGRSAHAFAFELVRDVVYGDISEPRRRLMHLRIARLPEALQQSGEQQADRVRHAALAGDMRLAAEACTTSARHCLRVSAYADAHAFARRGLVYAQSLEDTQRVPLTLELLQAAHAARHPRPDESDAVAGEIEALARQALASGRLHHARLGFHMLSYLRWESGTWADAGRYMLEAERVSRATSGRERVAALAEAALCLAMIERDLATADALALEAAAMAETTGYEPVSLIQAQAFLRLHAGQGDEARALFERAHLLARHEGDLLNAFQAREQTAIMALRQQDYEAAHTLCTELLSLAARLPDGSEGPFAEAACALCRWALDLGADDRGLEAALARLRHADSKQRLAALLVIAGEVDLRHGRVDAARRRCREALRLAELLESPSGRAGAEALLVRLGEAAHGQAAAGGQPFKAAT